MDKSVIKIGTKVMWSNGWGRKPEQKAVIEEIECNYDVETTKGTPTDQVKFEDKDDCIFVLTNGHWCYGNQIHEIVSQPEDEQEIEVRITWRSEIYIKGKSIDEIREKWENTGLFSADALDLHADFVDLCSAERVDDDSYDEVDF